MSTYLVVRRIKEDRIYLPGEKVVDPPWAAILMERGFLQPVPDDFTTPAAASRAHKVAAQRATLPGSGRSSKSGTKDVLQDVTYYESTSSAGGAAKTKKER